MTSGTVRAARRKPRNLALELVEGLGDRIRDGRIAPGEQLPTEAAVMSEFGVSRTVVREALSKLQASGLVETRHGIGSFALGLGDASVFRIAPEQFETLREVIAVLELRLGIETEAAALAAQRRTKRNLADLRTALGAFDSALNAGRDAVGPDFQFHLEIARATQNAHFAELMGTLGLAIIPRRRLQQSAELRDARTERYLRGVNVEHRRIFDAIANEDSDGARAAMRAHLANSRDRRRRANSGFRLGIP